MAKRRRTREQEMYDAWVAERTRRQRRGENPGQDPGREQFAEHRRTTGNPYPWQELEDARDATERAREAEQRHREFPGPGQRGTPGLSPSVSPPPPTGGNWAANPGSNWTPLGDEFLPRQVMDDPFWSPNEPRAMPPLPKIPLIPGWQRRQIPVPPPKPKPKPPPPGFNP
jgi:hypothetical protein